MKRSVGAVVARAVRRLRGRFSLQTTESPIANANPATFAKRAREVEKKRKADDKRAKRVQRKQAAKSGSAPAYY